MKQDLKSYYDERANEYDRVYLNPKEQEDLEQATKIFQNLFLNKTVLEFACGTGYWTERIGKTAKSIYATDVNKSVIKIAEERRKLNNITYEVADMYDFESENKYEGFFGGFIWSHIKIQDLDNFVGSLKRLIKPDGKIAFIDSNPLKSTNHDLKRIIKTDDFGNTYQKRMVENGNKYLVLKNFPNKEFICEKLSKIANNIEIVQTKYYWTAFGEIKNKN